MMKAAFDNIKMSFCKNLFAARYRVGLEKACPAAGQGFLRNDMMLLIESP